jgi:transposase-like protein
VDEGFVTINGKRHALGRAVDQAANVLDIRGQRRRHTLAAPQGLRKWLKGSPYVPRVMLTEQGQS